jgi:hypothetical protein
VSDQVSCDVDRGDMESAVGGRDRRLTRTAADVEQALTGGDIPAFQDLDGTGFHVGCEAGVVAVLPGGLYLRLDGGQVWLRRCRDGFDGSCCLHHGFAPLSVERASMFALLDGSILGKRCGTR